MRSVLTTSRALGLDFQSLEQALLVFDVGSFRKAAELLGTEPSVVSRRIRVLEDEIGVSLFHRQVRGVQPTNAGLELLGRIRRIVDEGRLIVTAGRRAGEGRDGALCIGIVASIAGGGVRDLLSTFLADHPNIAFNVAEGSPREHIRDVQALRVDASIAVGQPAAPGLKTETLWTEPIVVALPASGDLAQMQSVAWDTLNGSRFLVSRTSPGPEIQDYIVQHLAALGRHPLIEPRTVGRDGLLALIGLDQGVTLVSGAEAAVSYPGVIFRPLNGEQLPFSLIWSEENDNPVLRRFMSHARRWSAARAMAEASGAALQTHDPSP
jgi:DNA-binding transcriptional LysR family regulator